MVLIWRYLLLIGMVQSEFRMTRLPNATEFKRLLDAGRFSAIIDVRSRGEWEAGHIESATFIESLASFGTASQISTPADLGGCEECDFAVYCQSGGRAAAAIEHLKNAGFSGHLFNGLGVSQWTNAGFPLVATDSVPLPCADGQTNRICISQTPATPAPTDQPIPMATAVPTKSPITVSTPNPTGSPVTAYPIAIASPTESPIEVSTPKLTASPVTASPIFIPSPTENPITASTSKPTGSPATASPPVDLSSPQVINFNSSVEFKALLDSKQTVVLIDVRRKDEWDEGHIENATLVESLASYGTDNQVATPADLKGCEYCDLALYCRTGRRAGEAIDILRAAGFRGRLYNGWGVTQWVEAGYELVLNSSSVRPAPCVESALFRETCRSDCMDTMVVATGAVPTATPSADDMASSGLSPTKSPESSSPCRYGLSVVIAIILVSAAI